ncbi:hypothetical protein FVEN_g13094 [Fusarium venenatum]|nr:hypothetical protein FVEN_g13094 [Fusarium venenatum]
MDGASKFQVPSPNPSNGRDSRSLDWQSVSKMAHYRMN